MMNKYYEGYDARYRKIHSEAASWFSEESTPIVLDAIRKYGLSCSSRLLELGCGEGRDAAFLLKNGFSVFATDISPEAIRFCQQKNPVHSDSFAVLDCINGKLDGKFDFIYAVAVLHMLVKDSDRSCFWQFIREHLAPGGTALVCSMGDGEAIRTPDLNKPEQMQATVNDGEFTLPVLPCRMVNFSTMYSEVQAAGLDVIESGITCCEPDFPVMMYVIVK